MTVRKKPGGRQQQAADLRWRASRQHEAWHPRLQSPLSLLSSPRWRSFHSHSSFLPSIPTKRVTLWHCFDVLLPDDESFQLFLPLDVIKSQTKIWSKLKYVNTRMFSRHAAHSYAQFTDFFLIQRTKEKSPAVSTQKTQYETSRFVSIWLVSSASFKLFLYLHHLRSLWIMSKNVTHKTNWWQILMVLLEHAFLSQLWKQQKYQNCSFFEQTDSIEIRKTQVSDWSGMASIAD